MSRDNKKFASNPSEFLREKQVTQCDFTFSAHYKRIYGRLDPKRNTRTIADFKVYYSEHLNPHKKCPPITTKKVVGSLRETRNFSVPGTDLIQNFWWKSFPSAHVHLACAYTRGISGGREKAVEEVREYSQAVAIKLRPAK